MVLHEFDYLFAIAVIFAALDAWNIGANDVANSWATAVGSRSVTYLQAMLFATVMEFAGSLGVGSQVADTIRTKVVSVSYYNSAPGVLMLGMVCAVVASATYLTIATRLGFPVSTTHSIMGGVIGMGIASVGASKVNWVTAGAGTAIINGGVIQVFLAWILTPVIAAAFASIIFLITKHAVMRRPNPALMAIYSVPFYSGFTAGMLAMLLLWKGGSYTINFDDTQLAGLIVGVAVTWGVLTAIFLVPWLYRIVIKEDWELRWYHVALGPLLLRRGDVPPMPEGVRSQIQDFYSGHLTMEELEKQRGHEDIENFEDKKDASEAETAAENKQAPKFEAFKPKLLVGPKPEGPWYSGAVIFWAFRWVLFQGVDRDVVAMQSNEDAILSGDLDKTHAYTEHQDNRAEYVFTFLQVLTSMTASFSHGANDISNAVGPFATVYEIWSSGAVPSSTPVDRWILGAGGAFLVIGLWTYGYNIMRNLGNRVTLHSPSRGFSMELGSAITVIIATRLKLPVSTTQCITGATVGVGLCAGTWRAINWRMVAWIYAGWIITLPVAGIMSGSLMGIILNAPRWGMA
ncbi:Na+/Pi symporter [Cladochytrium tenue]|nr:Na+/Pi symporter [Cladochytrium tenue]